MKGGIAGQNSASTSVASPAQCYATPRQESVVEQALTVAVLVVVHSHYRRTQGGTTMAPNARRQSAACCATAQREKYEMHVKLDILAEQGFVVLRDYAGPHIPPDEWLNLEYKDWKSGGDTNFAPVASAFGAMECAGFWDHGKPDKDGIWTENAKRCPTLVRYVESVGANYGRVRIIKLNPNTEDVTTQRYLHLDDNNRLNPDGDGWVVRTWLQLSDDPYSYMILREKRDNPATESRISMPRNRQLVVDSERLWHAVWHPGPEPRYALITSFETRPPLKEWIESQLP
jgi:hypothetical protein